MWEREAAPLLIIIIINPNFQVMKFRFPHVDNNNKLITIHDEVGS